MATEQPGLLRDFYRKRLRQIWLIRVFKNTVWVLMWMIRWKILYRLEQGLGFLFWAVRWRIVRPLARAIFPRATLNRLHGFRDGGFKSLIRRRTVPALPLVSVNDWINTSIFDFNAEPGVNLKEPNVRLESTSTLNSNVTVVLINRSENVCIASPMVYSGGLGICVPIHDQSYSFPRIEVIEVRDAEVVGRSNLVSSKGQVIHHDLYRFSHDFTSEELHGKVVINPKKKTIRRISKPEIKYKLAMAAVFTDSCSSNYAHWLTEVLPRINIFCRTQHNVDVPLIVDSGLHPNIEASLMAVAGAEAKIIRLNVGDAAYVERLLVTSPTGYIPFDRRINSKSGHIHGVFSPYAISFLREQLAKSLSKPVKSLPDKIFLRRNSHSRLMKNEQLLEERLITLGFTIVQPEILSFSEQFHLFSAASIIVGATGAALANLIFCLRDVRIVICISAHPDHSFGYWQNMAVAAGTQVTYVLGSISGPKAQGVHADFLIDVDEVVRAIER
ncbi:MAG: glycosyltransferase family 61 protein [Glaciimonas sp.]|nr:glycosyltransferase family 61 protein [Glaciimonas sp.]